LLENGQNNIRLHANKRKSNFLKCFVERSPFACFRSHRHCVELNIRFFMSPNYINNIIAKIIVIFVSMKAFEARICSQLVQKTSVLEY
jgi:hypothetical protein